MSDAGRAVPAAAFAAPFLAMLEALRMPPTFARGRRDARAGHVRQLTVSGSLVVAQVRGPEEATARRARIAVRAFGAAEWSRVEDALAAEARYVADLLAGRMPADIGTVFAGAGLSLLPLSIGEIAMDCTCERPPMPCAHLAATCYALARSFDEDPFGAFAWRGRSRDELLHRLSRLRGAVAVAGRAAAVAEPDPAGDGGLGDPAGFWGPGGTPPGSPPAPCSTPAPGPPPGAASFVDASTRPPSVPGAASAGGRPDALLDQVEPPPLAIGGRPLTEVLRPAYQALPGDP